MRELKSARRGAKRGEARGIVVFLHGYGADGADLLSLAEPLKPHLPHAAFYAPDAPEPCTGNPIGRQWFPIPWLDGSTEAAAGASLARSSADLEAFLDRVLAEEGLAADRLALVGFSQGTMMALHVAPTRREPVACLVGFSGRLLDGSRFGQEGGSRFPVLLLHGDADEVVPPQSLSDAAEALSAAQFEVHAHVMRGVAHGISPEGLGLAAGFLIEHLPPN
jgi:phospholipase/carboxylesterase